MPSERETHGHYRGVIVGVELGGGDLEARAYRRQNPAMNFESSQYDPRSQESVSCRRFLRADRRIVASSRSAPI